MSLAPLIIILIIAVIAFLITLKIIKTAAGILLNIFCVIMIVIVLITAGVVIETNKIASSDNIIMLSNEEEVAGYFKSEDGRFTSLNKTSLEDALRNNTHDYIIEVSGENVLPQEIDNKFLILGMMSGTVRVNPESFSEDVLRNLPEWLKKEVADAVRS